jgi:hypothetical protein
VVKPANSATFPSVIDRLNSGRSESLQLKPDGNVQSRGADASVFFKK